MYVRGKVQKVVRLCCLPERNKGGSRQGKGDPRDARATYREASPGFPGEVELHRKI